MAQQKVLVMDTDASVREQVRAWLTLRGYVVEGAATGASGVQMHASTGYPVVFVDLKMRDLDARYIVRELKRVDPETAVIVTAYPDETNLVGEAMGLDATDYVAKPFKAEDISFKVKRALEGRTFTVNNVRALKGIEERNISLQKQNLMLARRIEESTRNLTRLYEDLRETYMRTIKALAHAIDARDHYTYAHSDNVARTAQAIAREMGLDIRSVEDIQDACQLHDLGKIGVHDNILSKPMALTVDEFAEIKTHAAKGAQILEPLNFLENVIGIVRHHHERWDGKGYPDGLAGEAIPLGARIMTVADSYDAMVSARPYRKIGLSKKEACTEIQRHSGAQFDPKVVEAFLRIVDRE